MSFTVSLNDPNAVSRRAYVLMQVPTVGEIELTISGITESKTPSVEATAEAMAAAVLAGDMVAARALADWLCENVSQPE